MNWRSVFGLIGGAATVGALMLGGAQVSCAQTTAAATGNWSTVGTWNPSEPVAGTAAAINGGFTVTVVQVGEVAATLDVGSGGGTGNLEVDAPGALTLGTLMRVGVGAGSTGVVDMTGGTVRVNGAFDSGIGNGELLVGDAGGNGTVNMSGGTFSTADEIFIGLGAGSVGEVNVSGGSFSTNPGGRAILVGFAGGNGTLDVSGTGDVDARFDMLVGFLEGSTATINLSDTGTIDAGFLFTNFAAGGAGSTVTMSQTGGTYTARIAYVLGQGRGTTTMTHSGGLIQCIVGAGDMVVSDGNLNTTTYDISGTAAVTLSDEFIVAAFNGSNGTVNQTGGTITARNIVVGREGDGLWNLSGGTINAANALMGDFDTGDGVMKVTGGTLNLTGNLSVGGALASNGGQALDVNGTFVVSGPGGTIDVAGNLLANPADNTRIDGPDNVGTLVFEVLGGGVSIIDAAGIADLTGAGIDVDLLSSFPLGSFFDLITATDVSEDYFQVAEDLGQISLSIVSGGNGEILRATVIPEPATVALAGIGALAVVAMRRRKIS